MTMFHFLSAMVDGPGYLPLGWKPNEVLKLYYFTFPRKMWIVFQEHDHVNLQGGSEELEDLLQWCGECAGYKAPRAHHCRKCGRFKTSSLLQQIQCNCDLSYSWDCLVHLWWVWRIQTTGLDIIQYSMQLNLYFQPKVCSKDGPPLPVDKQLCWSFQPRTLLGLSHISCPGVLNISNLSQHKFWLNHNVTPL